jgi:hypothetical protein
MASSSTLHSSDSTVVAKPEPVLQGSLSYWERQSATYNGVLGVCAVTSLTDLSLAAHSVEPGQAVAYGSGVRPLSYPLSVRQDD